LQAIVGLEGLALSDAERFEHLHPPLVDLADRLLLNDLRKLAPVVEAAWCRRAPLDILATNEPARLGLADSPHPVVFHEPVVECRVLIEDSQSDKDVVRCALKNLNAVFCIFCRIIVRADHDIGRTCASIGAGKPEVKNWPLPEVEHAAGSLPRRIIDLDSSVFQIAEIEDVRSSQVCGDDARFSFNDSRTTKSVALSTP
jgi:hypothetical protein